LHIAIYRSRILFDQRAREGRFLNEMKLTRRTTLWCGRVSSAGLAQNPDLYFIMPRIDRCGSDSS
jgi:hypothetical protein